MINHENTLEFVCPNKHESSVWLEVKMEWDGPVSDLWDGTAPFSVWLTKDGIDPFYVWLKG